MSWLSVPSQKLDSLKVIQNLRRQGGVTCPVCEKQMFVVPRSGLHPLCRAKVGQSVVWLVRVLLRS